MRSAAMLSFVLCLTIACDDDEGPTRDERSDVETLRRLMVDDPALQPLEELDALVDSRPVVAARLIETGALPAARTHADTADAMVLSSERGRSIGLRVRRVYRSRITALEQYQTALGGGIATADDDLLNALDAMSDVEGSLMGVHRDLDSIIPLEAASDEATP